MEAPLHIVEGLKGIRSGLHLKWNNAAKYIPGTGWDAHGKIKDAGYEPRWEVWDEDAQGKPYRVMTLESPTGEFLPPGEWLIEHINYRNPERFGGDVEKMLKALVDEPNDIRRYASQKGVKEMHEYIANWWWRAAAPKSAPGRTFRGQTFRSAGADPQNLN